MALRTVAFQTEDGTDYYEDEIVSILKSKELKDKWKLDDLIVEAVDSDDPVPLQYLLNNGYKIGQIYNYSGKTFLHGAFYKDAYEILTTGMDIWAPHVTEEAANFVDSKGLTLLHIACYSTEGEEFAKKCLEHNANVNAHFIYDRDDEQRNGFTPLHFAAINSEGLSLVQLLLEHNADVNARDSRGRTPLHLACQFFENPEGEVLGVYVDITKELLYHGDVDMNVKDGSGNTPLLSLFPKDYNAFNFTEYIIVDVPIKETLMKLNLLLKLLPDVTLTNRRGDTILHLIIKNLKHLRRSQKNYIPRDMFHSEIIQLVYIFNTKDFNFNVKNNRGETPLQLAIHYLSADIVKTLLSSEAAHFDFQSNVYLEYLLSHRTVNVVPKMHDTVNFLRIIELLDKKGVEIDCKWNLKILEYLVHDNCRGECGYIKYRSIELISTNLLDIVNFGSSSHFREVYERLVVGLGDRSRTLMFNLVVDNLKIRKYANFYVDSTLPTNFILDKQLETALPKDMSEKLESELNRIKNFKIKGTVSLYDLMSKHPHKIYKYLADVNLNSYSFNSYALCKNIIEGHLTKSVVRHYVENSAFESLHDLLSPPCPSLCCKTIMNFLSNKDLLNVCMAIINQ